MSSQLIIKLCSFYFGRSCLCFGFNWSFGFYSIGDVYKFCQKSWSRCKLCTNSKHTNGYNTYDFRVAKNATNVTAATGGIDYKYGAEIDQF